MNIDMEKFTPAQRLGEKLKKFRLENKYTLNDVSRKLNFSSAFLSMVEHGKSGIRFENLHRLLTLYGRNFGDLTDNVQTPSALVNTINAIPIAEEPGVLLHGLASQNSLGYMGGFLIKIAPGASNAFDSHSGLEYVIVKSGDIRLILIENGEKRQIDMHSGDTETHCAEYPHTYENIGTTPAEIYIIECSIGNP